MHARTGRLQVSTDRLDDVVGQIQSEHIPNYKHQQGYKGFTVLVNRQTGDLIGVSFWEAEADLEAAEELGEQTRARAAETGRAATAPVTERWEVVIDDMV